MNQAISDARAQAGMTTSDRPRGLSISDAHTRSYLYREEEITHSEKISDIVPGHRVHVQVDTGVSVAPRVLTAALIKKLGFGEGQDRQG